MSLRYQRFVIVSKFFTTGEFSGQRTLRFLISLDAAFLKNHIKFNREKKDRLVRKCVFPQ